METRITGRVGINLKIASSLDAEAGQKFSLAKGNIFEVEGIDISLGGLGVNSNYFLPKGLRIILEIKGELFGLKAPLKIKGEVCYCKFIKGSQYRCGIKFVDLPQEYKDKISNFVATFERRSEPRLKLAD